MQIRNVNFYYGPSQALKNINLTLHDKSVTAFIGPSGCGKSTLLRILNRIYELYPGQRATGEVLVDGENILSPGLDLNLLRAKIGMVFQKPTPFPMSIHDNIAFGIRLYERLPQSELDDRIESALRRAALWDEVKDKLKQSGLSLSGGQQQRLCIARAIAVKPEILLLDEPASALDPISTQRIEELIAELKPDYCIAIVTHNMQQAARSSDYTAFMYLGELIEFDETETHLYPPERAADRRLHHRPLRLTRGGFGQCLPSTSSRATTRSCAGSTISITEMGGLAESQLAAAIEAVVERDSDLAASVVEGDAKVDQLQRDLDNLAIAAPGVAPADGARSARDLRRDQDRQRSRTHLRLRRQCRQALDRARPVAAGAAGPRAAAHGAAGASCWSRT